MTSPDPVSLFIPGHLPAERTYHHSLFQRGILDLAMESVSKIKLNIEVPISLPTLGRSLHRKTTANVRKCLSGLQYRLGVDRGLVCPFFPHASLDFGNVVPGLPSEAA